MTDRKPPTVAVWISAALVAVLVGYPLSFGPACWVCSRYPMAIFLWEAADFVYAPILYAWYDGPKIVTNVIAWYANLGAAAHLTVAKMLDESFCIIQG